MPERLAFSGFPCETVEFKRFYPKNLMASLARAGLFYFISLAKTLQLLPDNHQKKTGWFGQPLLLLEKAPIPSFPQLATFLNPDVARFTQKSATVVTPIKNFFKSTPIAVPEMALQQNDALLSVLKLSFVANSL